MISIEPVGCIQLAYYDRIQSKYKCVLIFTAKLKRKKNSHQKRLPSCLLELFRDPTISFAGINIQGDINKMSNDFVGVKSIFDHRAGENIVDLGEDAARKGVFPNRNVGLQTMHEVLFNQRLLKDQNALFSDWSTSEPTKDQKRCVGTNLIFFRFVCIAFATSDTASVSIHNRYASDDGIGHLRACDNLLDRPDLTRQLMPSDANAGTKVDIVPRHGSLLCMASRGATAVILEPTTVTPPKGITAKFTQPADGMVAVKIETLYLPFLLVPGAFPTHLCSTFDYALLIVRTSRL